MRVWIVAWVIIGLSLGGATQGLAEESRPAQQASSEGFRYDPHGRRDPFVSLVRDGRLVATIPGTRLESSRPKLSGILWDPGGQSIAIINEEEVRVGDTVIGYKVLEIREDAVVLTNGGVPMILEIEFEAPPEEASKERTTTGGEKP